MFRFFFFNDTATTEIYTLSLHDALPISRLPHSNSDRGEARKSNGVVDMSAGGRSEEHTSELQSRLHLVCRLLLEKKKQVYRFLSVQMQGHLIVQPRLGKFVRCNALLEGT